MPRPGRSTNHWRVGRAHAIIGVPNDPLPVCVSVTYWGSNQVRWVRLRFADGSEKSYAPSHLMVAPR